MKVFNQAAMKFIFICLLCCFNFLFAQNFHLVSQYDVNNYDQGIKVNPADVVEVAPVCTNLGQVKSSVKYPENAVETGLEGNVTVKVLVGPVGDVLKISSVSGPDAFHKEVRDKAKKLKFLPALENNKPVKVWVTVRFSFRLK